MASFIKETPAGQFLRLLGFQQHWLLYPEEIPGFEPNESTSDFERGPSPVESDLEKTVVKVPATIRSSEKDQSADDPDVKIVAFVENDPANPRNWSQSKKYWTLIVVNLYTFCVYCTASIITPTAGVIQERYHVSTEVASLGLSMYVVGCKLLHT